MVSLDWVVGVTEDDLRALAPGQARIVRLLMLAHAVARAQAAGCTPAQPKRRNAQRRRRHGAGGRGSRRGHAKLNRQSVDWIKAWAAAGYSQRVIATAFGVSQPVVWSVLAGRTWRHV